MPTKDTQVYWYDLPTPKSPWRNAEELKQWLLASKRVTTQMTQHQWRNGCVAVQPPQIPARRALESRTEKPNRADRMRDRVTWQIERPLVFRRVVPEPHATPLQVVNLIMEHLKQRPVLLAEAAEVAERVTFHFNTLTQSSQVHSMPAPEGAVSRARRGRRGAGSFGGASATESVLSQVQQYDDMRPGPSYSQATNGAGGNTVGSLSVVLQDSLLLDTMAEFCAARKLTLRRLSRADLRAMRYRVSSLETVPHRRVVMLADRHDPVFVVLFGVSRQVTPEPFVVSALQMDGKTPESVPRYRKAKAPLTQLFCMAPAPVPWRRITTNISVSTLRDEFVVAVIELSDSEETADAGSNRKGKSPHRSGEKLDCAADDSADSPPHKMQRQEPVDLLGDDREESLCNQGPDANAGGGGNEAPIIPSPEASANSPRSSSPESLPLERRWLDSAPLFPNTARLAETAPLNLRAELMDSSNGVCDPLLSLPRLEGATRRRGSFHRAWYRRLLSKASGDSLARMCLFHTDE
ncbi:hypothetical protein JKF63_01315 [Porcisia hertigi]|uniref:Uncharacterized protein n=1 Tax=Porcisia hertigi TaxID=2761500 RepID=A0A836HXU6_9TRYP|nr:hypothetical protein JKF63_01315 [Porcisia hertigi]